MLEQTARLSQADPQQLTRDLVECRDRLTQVTRGFDGARLLGPKLDIVNPPLWEIGHIGWFQERWCLRQRPDGTLADSILPGADALYDSSRVAHDTRWDLPLPDIGATRTYLAAVLDRVRERAAREPGNQMLAYFVRLATFHEDMHIEAFHYTCQTLGYENPFEAKSAPAAEPLSGDTSVAGGTFELGARQEEGFVFDNEKWSHEVHVAPYRIARAAVTNAQYLEYVESGAQAPRYWERRDGVWGQRCFDRWVALAPGHPVVHVSWDEAGAYCRWAGRRLPTEAEWEYAAADGAAKRRYPWGAAAADGKCANLGAHGPVAVAACQEGDTPGGCRQMIGNVWEWTSSTFEPYPGFVPDPYKEYSAPWFGTHKVLRGGSFATPARLIRNTWRNFFTPGRADIFAGFRTCASDE